MKQHSQVKKHSKAAFPVMFSLLLGLFFTGCPDTGNKPGTTAAIAPKPTQPLTQATTTTITEEKHYPVYSYNAVGRRDPFAPLISFEEKKAKSGARPLLERYNITEFKLTGIVWGGFGYNAMLEGPDGKGYFVRAGTVIGPNKGVIKKITKDTLVIEEKFKNFSGETERKQTIIDLRKKQEGMQ